MPASAGVGFKPEHAGAILAAAQPIGFFEVHAENYMGAGGPPHAQLTALRDDANFSYAAAWEFKGVGRPPELHKEPLEFEEVHPSQRSYK